MKKKAQGCVRTVLTSENIETVRAAVIKSPNRSILCQAVLLKLCSLSIRRILVQDLHYYPYKLQIIQELKISKHLIRRKFCEQMMVKISEVNEFFNKLRISN